MSFVSLENAYKILGLMTQAAETLMLPRFGKLLDEHIQTKADQSVVTEVDMAVEEFLAAGLTALLPGSVVIGEESVEADPMLLEAVAGGDPVWIIDPLDGTRPFVEKRPGWGTLVSYLEGGVVQMAFVVDPVSRRELAILRGHGLYMNGKKIDVKNDSKACADMVGGVWRTNISPDVLDILDSNEKHFAGYKTGGVSCVECAFFLVEGVRDFVLSMSSNLWDVLPMAMVLEEIGGMSAYIADEAPLAGENLTRRQAPTLYVRNKAQWTDIRTRFFHGIPEERLRAGIRKKV